MKTITPQSHRGHTSDPLLTVLLAFRLSPSERRATGYGDEYLHTVHVELVDTLHTALLNRYAPYVC